MKYILLIGTVVFFSLSESFAKRSNNQEDYDDIDYSSGNLYDEEDDDDIDYSSGNLYDEDDNADNKHVTKKSKKVMSDDIDYSSGNLYDEDAQAKEEKPSLKRDLLTAGSGIAIGKAAQMKDKLKEKGSKFTNKAKEKASQMKDKLKEKASKFTNKAKEKASKLKNKVKDKFKRFFG